MARDLPTDVELLLAPGETVLWSGRPHYPYFRSEAWAAFVFGLIAMTAAAVGWLICCVVLCNIITHAQYRLLPALPFALLPAGGFSLVAAACLAAPWTCRRRLSRASYVVTDQRVYVRAAPGYARNGMIPEPSKELYVITPEQAKAYEVKRRQGQRVDLVFATEYARRADVEIGILGAEDWQGAERALRTAFG